MAKKLKQINVFMFTRNGKMVEEILRCVNVDRRIMGNK